MKNPQPLAAPTPETSREDVSVFACEIVHREGGGTTSRGLTEIEALSDAFAFVAGRLGKYVYISEPYRIRPTADGGCWDTTPPEHVRAHRDAFVRPKSVKQPRARVADFRFDGGGDEHDGDGDDITQNPHVGSSLDVEHMAATGEVREVGAKMKRREQRP